MTEKYPRGDPTPIIRSIEKAAQILRARGIYIDLTKEMPLASSADYWLVLNHLHADLWRRVYASDPKTKNCKVFKIHNDGDATLTCGGIEHVATTEGKLYKEIPKAGLTSELCTCPACGNRDIMEIKHDAGGNYATCNKCPTCFPVEK